MQKLYSYSARFLGKGFSGNSVRLFLTIPSRVNFVCGKNWARSYPMKKISVVMFLSDPAHNIQTFSPQRAGFDGITRKLQRPRNDSNDSSMHTNGDGVYRSRIHAHMHRTFLELEQVCPNSRRSFRVASSSKRTDTRKALKRCSNIVARNRTTELLGL